MRIAAGEVIERPASVVKELCDNAVDAGARRISVEVWGAGMERIRVTDDGVGMDPEDARLCLLRHATSKLRQVEDLLSVPTLGFRGEALPSIAAVSRIEVRTRPPASDAGTSVTSVGGSGPECVVVGAAPGTTVEVCDLFFNLPARRTARLATSRGAEIGAITDAVTAAAFARPDVAFSLAADGKEVCRTAGSGQLRDVAVAIWGVEIGGSLLPLKAEDGDWQLRGLTAPPAHCRGNRAAQVVVIGGRPVRAQVVGGAIEAAYRGLLMVHRYPVFVVQLVGPRQDYDINVHPSKHEVRLHSEQALRRLCYRGARQALSAAELIPNLPLPAPEWVAQVAEASATRYEAPGATRDAWPPARAEAQLPPLAQEQRLPFLRPLGQIAESFIVAEGSGGLYVIDQHAAHERVYFERLEGQEASTGQLLLVPEVVELSGEQWTLWTEAAEFLASMGLRAEPFGPQSLVVRAVPPGWDGSPVRALEDVLDRWQREERSDPQGRARRAMAACKAAIKAGQALTREDIEALVRDLGRCRDPFHCPHGRPTFLRVGRDELARHFGRH